MNDTDDSLASRMYPTAEAPRKTVHPAANVSQRMYPDQPDGDVAAHRAPETPLQAQQSVEDLIAEGDSLADRMYGQDQAVEPATYDTKALHQSFDGLQQYYRSVESEADMAALAEGREETALLLAEMAVPVDLARDISSGLSEWHGREPLDDVRVEEYRGKTEATLRAEWGSKYDANIKLAQAAGAEAMKRLPWLRDLFETGAGNDPAIVRHFARIGLKNARRAKK